MDPVQNPKGKLIRNFASIGEQIQKQYNIRRAIYFLCWQPLLGLSERAES